MWLSSLLPFGRKPQAPARRVRSSIPLMVEELGQRTLPSSSPLAAPLGEGAAAVGSYDYGTERPFQVKGTFSFSFDHGHHVHVVASGTTASDRFFRVDGFVKLVQPQSKHPLIRGTLTMDFGSGNTLDVYYEASVYDKVAEGPYQITGGTGYYQGASGSGVIWYPIGQDQPFTLDGTLIL